MSITPGSTTVSNMIIISITGTDSGIGYANTYYQNLVGSGACPSSGDAGYVVYPASFMLPGTP